MDMMECIETRRSHRRFLPKPVPEELLAQVLEAGRCAPTGGNTQQFHFIVITNKQVMQDLAQLVKHIYAGMDVEEGMYGSVASSINQSKRGQYVFHYDPPAFIIVANRRGYPNALADSACALQNMMLTCNELGLGSVWINQLRLLDSYIGVTGKHPELDDMIRSLGITEDETVCGALSLGYVETLNRKPMERRSKITYIR